MTFYSRTHPFSFITIWDVLVPDFAVYTPLTLANPKKQNKTKQHFLLSSRLWRFNGILWTPMNRNTMNSEIYMNEAGKIYYNVNVDWKKKKKTEKCSKSAATIVPNRGCDWQLMKKRQKKKGKGKKYYPLHFECSLVRSRSQWPIIMIAIN